MEANKKSLKKLDKKLRALTEQIATLDAVHDRLSLETPMLLEGDAIYNFFVMEQLASIRQGLVKQYQKLSKRRADIFGDCLVQLMGQTPDGAE